MGLDQFVFSYRGTEPPQEHDFEAPENSIEVCYWRKHPNLHGWMQNLYIKKSGNSFADFNGDNLLLTISDIKALKADIENDNLPETIGFFFGVSERTDEQKEIDLGFCEDALNILNKGDFVYYTSSW